MAEYVVSARKYRPKSFEEVVGQSHITTTLTNAIKSQQLAHAMLFCGPRGIGKTTCARILAKNINEFDDQAMDGGMSMNIFELDAASNNTVDDIRNLIDQVRYPPQVGKYKVYIIDEVHMLSKSAFNAFLKTLEEPPSYAIFILATTEKHKVLPTILSRCQIYDFNRIDVIEIEAHLSSIGKKEEIKAEEDALHLIAQKSDGSLRDALSLFDQLLAFSGDNSLTYEQVLKNLHILDYDYYLRLTEMLNNEDHEASVLLFDEILSKGFDGMQLVGGFLEHLRNLMMMMATGTSKLVAVPKSALAQYEKQSKEIDRSLLLSWISILQNCEQQYSISQNQRILVELSLIKMAHVRGVIALPSVEPEKKKSSPEVISEKPESSANHESQDSKPEPIPLVEEPQPEVNKGESKPEEPIESKPEEIIKENENVKSDPGSKKKISIKPRIASSINLNEEVKEEVESEPDLLQLQEEIPVDQEFDLEMVLNAWKEFVDARIKEAPQGLVRVLEKRPSLDGNKIIIDLGNPIEDAHLDKVRAELNYHLKKSLKNKEAELVSIINVEKKEKVPYTSAEKFEVLSKENPALNDLKDKLGLEIEF